MSTTVQTKPSLETMPSPELFFESAFAYQRSAALKTAIDLDLFTAIGDTPSSVDQIATRCQATPRGIRILSHYLASLGFLDKRGETFALTPVSAAFLSKSSPTYLGGTLQFLSSADVMRNFDHLTETVRRGTIAPAGNNTVSEENPMWVTFAEAMLPMMMPNAMAIAEVLNTTGKTRVLDIAAGHGIFGIMMAQRNPEAEIVAVDWPSVLEVAKANATKFGVNQRYRTNPGDAFKVDFGTGFDVALITNFLHHFDVPTCVDFMRKVAAALKPGGRAVVLEFVPNADKVSPPFAAQFGLTMLAGTPGGDVYSLDELKQMYADSGFSRVTAHPTPTPQTVVVGTKG
jgi:2-polyprenyl-3-methyl-5-hydroxy-6-metoxy-1,4-benzoquinol methylase